MSNSDNLWGWKLVTFDYKTILATKWWQSHHFSSVIIIGNQQGRGGIDWGSGWSLDCVDGREMWLDCDGVWWEAAPVLDTKLVSLWPLQSDGYRPHDTGKYTTTPPNHYTPPIHLAGSNTWLTEVYINLYFLLTVHLTSHTPVDSGTYKPPPSLHTQKGACL